MKTTKHDSCVAETECVYCGRLVTEHTVVPSARDSGAWEEIKREHAPNCEWAATRAHREAARS